MIAGEAKLAVRWLQSLEAFLRQGRSKDRAQEVGKGGTAEFPDAVLSLLAALLVHKDPRVKKQAIMTAAYLPEFEPLLGINMLPLLVYALKETISGIAFLPNEYSSVCFIGCLAYALAR